MAGATMDERKDNTEALYVMRNGEVLNRHEQFTPVLNFAHAFPAPYARKLATEKGGYCSVLPITDSFMVGMLSKPLTQ